jgi:alpha-ketoglutarate-dependent taurine dioxygenase
MNDEIIDLYPFGVLIKAMKKNAHIKHLDIRMLRKYFLEKQIIVLRGFHTFETSEEFSLYCEHWGEICIWPFGKVLELKKHINPQDHIFDHSYIPLHWDGMYRPQVPEYQIFHCVEAPLSSRDGRTVFSNTILAIENMSWNQKQCWSQIKGIYKRKMEFYHSKTISPVIVKHPYRDFFVIRYQEAHCEDKGNFINPPEIEFQGVDKLGLINFHQQIKEILYSHDSLYAHEWHKGDVVISDNFSLLHGREKFESCSPRHLQRVQVLSDPPFHNPGLEFYQ